MKSPIVKLDAKAVAGNWQNIVTGTSVTVKWNKRRKDAGGKIDAVMLADMQKIQDAALAKLIKAGTIGWARKRDAGLKWTLTEKSSGAAILSFNGQPVVDGQASLTVAFPQVQAEAFIKKFEGKINHLYLDTAGKVTVGYGHLIPSADAAVKLHTGGTPFLAREDIYRAGKDLTEASQKIKLPAQDQAKLVFAKGNMVDEAQVRFDYAAVAAASAGMSATLYENYSQTAMSDSSTSTIFATDVAEFMPFVRKRFPHLSSYPAEVQLILLDFMYNIGPTKFVRSKWPRFFEALDRRDWKGMANESNRNDGKGNDLGTRNTDSKRLLLNAFKGESFFLLTGTRKQLRLSGDLK